MADLPKLTVVMPAHNTESYIRQAIQSILNQTVKNYQFWILENGSSDRTLEIAQQFEDPRIKVFELGPVGFQGALQFALDNVETEWIARMDSDDISPPRRLERQLQCLAEHPEIKLLGGSGAILTPFGHIIERLPRTASRAMSFRGIALGKYSQVYPEGRICLDPSMLINRPAALEVGGYDREFTMGDVPLWLRMLKTYQGYELAECLYIYRLRHDSFSRTHNEGIQVRAKYAPKLLQSYMKNYGLTGLPMAAVSLQQRRILFWKHIAFLEELAGSPEAIRLAIEHMATAEADPHTIRQAKCKQWAARFLRPLRVRQYRRSYRHRPDLERLLTEQGIALQTLADPPLFKVS